MTTNEKISKDLILALSKGLEEDDWVAFASLLSRIDPALGAFEALHARAADGDSPRLMGNRRWQFSWEYYTLRDARMLEAEGISTPEEAIAYWMERYGQED